MTLEKITELLSAVQSEVSRDVPREDLERLALLGLAMLSDRRLSVVRGQAHGKPATILCANLGEGMLAPLAVMLDALDPDLTGPGGEGVVDMRTGEPAKQQRELPTGMYL